MSDTTPGRTPSSIIAAVVFLALAGWAFVRMDGADGGLGLMLGVGQVLIYLALATACFVCAGRPVRPGPGAGAGMRVGFGLCAVGAVAACGAAVAWALAS